jgi:RimJ/RimL family protein N-acetyltransferase
MSHSIVVRPAVEADGEALLRLRAACFEETEFMLWEPGEFKDSVDDEERRIARLNGQPNSSCLVGADGDELVGFLNAMGGQVNRLRHCTSLALGVRRSHWGRGVGSALLRRALAWAREAQLRRVELTVRTDNERALNLYKRFGFQVEGVRRCSLLVGGLCKDEYLMSILNVA